MVIFPAKNMRCNNWGRTKKTHNTNGIITFCRSQNQNLFQFTWFFQKFQLYLIYCNYIFGGKIYRMILWESSTTFRTLGQKWISITVDTNSSSTNFVVHAMSIWHFILFVVSAIKFLLFFIPFLHFKAIWNGMFELL